MTNANSSMIHTKKGKFSRLLSATPLQFLQKYAPWIADKVTVFRPTERLVEHPFIHENIPFCGDKRILDVGSGVSILPLELASKGYEVYAMDLARGYHRRIRHSRFTFVKGDIRRTEFPDNFFDTVTAVSSIEHIGLECRKIDLSGDRKAIQEIARILKPEGMLIITVPFGQKGLYPSEDHPCWRTYDLPALQLLLHPLEIELMKFALLGEDMSWRPGSLEEVKHIDSLCQHRWYSAKAIAMGIARKSRLS